MIHKYDSLGYLYPEVLERWSDKNKKSPYEFAPQSEKTIWLKCPDNEHEDYPQKINNAVNRNFRCPRCIAKLKSSILQLKIEKYINENYGNYTLLHEQYCTINPKNPKTGYKMRFDNEIKELKLLIETMGIQHYEINNLTKLYARKNKIEPEKALKWQQERDKIKKEEAIKEGYYYLAIPYTLEENDKYKKVIDDKINEIISLNQTN